MIPAEQMPMAQKPVMMRGRLPSFSMVKHCRGRAETTGVRRELQTRMGAPSEPQIQMEVGRCSQWHLGVGGSLSSELQGWDQGMGRVRTPGSQGECALGGSGVPQSPIRVQGWGWLGWPRLHSDQHRVEVLGWRGGGWSRQGIDSRTNACNFITNLSMSIGGHLRGCS